MTAKSNRPPARRAAQKAIDGAGISIASEESLFHSPARVTTGPTIDLDRVRHFRLRVLSDALSEATANYWNRRAEAFEAAAPRPGDFTGRATQADLDTLTRRCRKAAEACRQRALVESTATPPIPPIIVAELAGEGVTTW